MIDLRQQIEPVIDAFAKQLQKLLERHVNELVASAFEAARSALHSDLDRNEAADEVAPPAPPTVPPPPAATRRRPKEIEQKPEKLHTRCSRCGKPGHNARTCTYEPVSERPAAPVSRIDRFAKIEASARTRVGITAEQAAARRVSGTPSIADELAVENPCRDENCRRADMHGAHP